MAIFNPKKTPKKTTNARNAWAHAFMANFNPKKTLKKTKNDESSWTHAFMSKPKISPRAVIGVGGHE